MGSLLEDQGDTIFCESSYLSTLTLSNIFYVLYKQIMSRLVMNDPKKFEGSVWTCNNLIRELLCFSFLFNSHLLSSPGTCHHQIRPLWVTQLGSQLKRVMGCVEDRQKGQTCYLS